MRSRLKRSDSGVFKLLFHQGNILPGKLLLAFQVLFVNAQSLGLVVVKAHHTAFNALQGSQRLVDLLCVGVGIGYQAHSHLGDLGENPPVFAFIRQILLVNMGGFRFAGSAGGLMPVQHLP